MYVNVKYMSLSDVYWGLLGTLIMSEKVTLRVVS